VKRPTSLTGVGRLLPFCAECRRVARRIPRASEAPLYPRLLLGFGRLDERLDRIEAVLDQVLNREKA
jgi:hypothetical protein